MTFTASLPGSDLRDGLGVLVFRVDFPFERSAKAVYLTEVPIRAARMVALRVGSLDRFWPIPATQSPATS